MCFCAPRQSNIETRIIIFITSLNGNSLLQEGLKPNVTVEIHTDVAVYKIQGSDLESLSTGLKLVQSFQKEHGAKLSKLSGVKSKDQKGNQIQSNSQPECKLPDWFAKSKPKVGEVIALVLYHASRPLTNIEITRIVEKEWHAVHLKNISKHLTTKGKFLYPYVTKDAMTKVFALNGKGKNWVSSEVIPHLMKTAEIIK